MIRSTARFVASPAHRRALLRHVENYGELACVEASMVATALRRRLVVAVLSGALALTAAILLGVSLMMASTLEGGWARYPALWLVPAAFALAAAVVALFAAGRTGSQPFEALREQLRADVEAMRRAIEGEDADTAATATSGMADGAVGRDAPVDLAARRRRASG